MSAAVVVLALTVSATTTTATADCARPAAPEFVSEDRPGSDAAYAVVLRADDLCGRAWMESVFDHRVLLDGPTLARTSSAVTLRFASEPGLRLYVEDAHGRLLVRPTPDPSVPPIEPAPPHGRWSTYRAVVTGPGTATLPRGRHRFAVARDDEPLREIARPFDVDAPLRIEARLDRSPVGRPVSMAMMGAGLTAVLVGGTWIALEETDHDLLLEKPDRVGPAIMMASGVVSAAVGALLYAWVFDEEATLDVQAE